MATAYAVNDSAGATLEKAVVRSSVFEPLKEQATVAAGRGGTGLQREG